MLFTMFHHLSQSRGGAVVSPSSDPAAINQNNNKNKTMPLNHHINKSMKQQQQPSPADEAMDCSDTDDSSSSSTASSYDSTSASGAITPNGEGVGSNASSSTSNATRSSSSTRSGSSSRRSMFCNYWKQTGQVPCNLKPIPQHHLLEEQEKKDARTRILSAAVEAAEQIIGDDDHSEEGSHDEDVIVPCKSLLEGEDEANPHGSNASRARGSSRRRRSILPRVPATNAAVVVCNRSNSVPLLNSSQKEEQELQTRQKKQSLLRTRRSTGELCKTKPLGSCLRESRFSLSSTASSTGSSSCDDDANEDGGGDHNSCCQEGKHRPTSATASTSPERRSQSLRFDMEGIDVVHFIPPQERYAEQGWSNYFA